MKLGDHLSARLAGSNSTRSSAAVGAVQEINAHGDDRVIQAPPDHIEPGARGVWVTASRGGGPDIGHARFSLGSSRSVSAIDYQTNGPLGTMSVTPVDGNRDDFPYCWIETSRDPRGLVRTITYQDDSPGVFSVRGTCLALTEEAPGTPTVATPAPGVAPPAPAVSPGALVTPTPARPTQPTAAATPPAQPTMVIPTPTPTR